jgi:hypothetical protein
MFYMFRTGKRRGKGKFHETYGLRKEAVGTKVRRAGSVSVENIAEKLSAAAAITGFSSEVGRAILADALLGFCFENRNHEPGRGQQVQRALPTHYFSSWIDLPDRLVHLRYVPEALVAILVDQKRGHAIELIKERSRFSLINSNGDIEANDLVMPFAAGLSIGVSPSSLRADDLDETASIGIDQLLTIRSARLCGERPATIRNSKEELDVIANRRPVVTRAAAHLREDVSVLLQVFGASIPRKALLPMLEASFGLGLTNVLLSTAASLFEWERSGMVPNSNEEAHWPLFVDASSGSDFEIRRVSEERCFDLAQRFDRLAA